MIIHVTLEPSIASSTHSFPSPSSVISDLAIIKAKHGMDLDHTPALPPPLNVEPNFAQLSGILPLRYAVSAVSLFLCSVFVAIRICVSRAVRANILEGAVLLSAAGFIAFTVIIILAGLEVEILYGPTIFGAKYAILRQIETIFFSHRRESRTYKAIRALIWANLAYYLATTFVYLLACIPREKIWNPTVDGHCINQQDVIVLTPALNVISDVTILVVPVAEVFKLQMPLKTKLSVAAIFAVGLLSLVAGILRSVTGRLESLSP
ncbi:hypothetical protein CHU98_g275 [Xylaria longipes]|nr:hypothetical protein CHU98_g275 [Xylaria longipes]